jgi:putative DNA-invertase from lambdoid prophage Rac
MTIYSYLRVSTNQQSVDMQREAIARKGVVIEDGCEYIDHGLSGSLAALDREGFKALCSSLSSGDTVYIYSLSRLGRNTANVLSTVDMLDSMGFLLSLLLMVLSQEALQVGLCSPCWQPLLPLKGMSC